MATVTLSGTLSSFETGKRAIQQGPSVLTEHTSTDRLPDLERVNLMPEILSFVHTLVDAVEVSVGGGVAVSPLEIVSAIEHGCQLIRNGYDGKVAAA